MLYRVILPYATFGVVEENGYVVKVAPIWKFCLGWDIERLKRYAEGKGSIEEVKRDENI